MPACRTRQSETRAAPTRVQDWLLDIEVPACVSWVRLHRFTHTISVESQAALIVVVIPLHDAAMGVVTDRAKLIARIEVEARAYRNADATIRGLRYGRVLGLLDAGATLGFWSRREAAHVSEVVRNGAGMRQVRMALLKLSKQPSPTS